MKKLEKIFGDFLHYGNKINFAAYSLSVIYAMVTKQFTHFPLEFWGGWLLSIGLGYGIEDYFLEGHTYISEKEFENGTYPSWVKNRGDYYISYENRDEEVYKIKRKVVFESRWFR